jgi:hypothetical protein
MSFLNSISSAIKWRYMAAFCCGLKLETPKIDASGKEANVEIWVVLPFLKKGII